MASQQAIKYSKRYVNYSNGIFKREFNKFNINFSSCQWKFSNLESIFDKELYDWYNLKIDNNVLLFQTVGDKN